MFWWIVKTFYEKNYLKKLNQKNDNCYFLIDLVCIYVCLVLLGRKIVDFQIYHAILFQK